MDTTWYANPHEVAIASDDHLNGIPIPVRNARERPDAVMGASYGPDSAQMDSAVAFLSVTPKSKDLDPENQFSPSSYLLGSIPRASPPPGGSVTDVIRYYANMIPRGEE